MEEKSGLLDTKSTCNAIVDQKVAVSIPIAQLYCDMPW